MDRPTASSIISGIFPCPSIPFASRGRSTFATTAGVCTRIECIQLPINPLQPRSAVSWTAADRIQLLHPGYEMPTLAVHHQRRRLNASDGPAVIPSRDRFSVLIA
ncbi:hypothetical protein FNV43_RR08934 [Rhamnella rubrinervis]|uniref:Uncharacterized protein n=1 Tax=Rhamnella rubrinervis TaxID=2594499 RepID=A0A8K0MJD6_9ROSA|nr:hypothetical protein FNV43_RR08934 [Rhamnella rubrinervis]